MEHFLILISCHLNRGTKWVLAVVLDGLTWWKQFVWFSKADHITHITFLFILILLQWLDQCLWSYIISKHQYLAALITEKEIGSTTDVSEKELVWPNYQSSNWSWRHQEMKFLQTASSCCSKTAWRCWAPVSCERSCWYLFFIYLC